MCERLEAVRGIMQSCRLCPRECGVNRLAGERGECKIGSEPMVSSVNLHHGEEPPISGTRGSGTVFLTGCSLRCRFCQNFPISQLLHGNTMSPRELAGKMLHLQSLGAHNINLVTPTHQSAAVFESVLIAYQQGLRIPLVYNSGGYDSLEMLRLWEGIIDIYMPDSKYSDDAAAVECSRAPDYVRHNRAALLEMHRQVGILASDGAGVAQRGLLIRHLVLPGDLSGTVEVLRFIAEELGRDTYISLMSQYFPAWGGLAHPVLSRSVTREEYRRACFELKRLGLDNGWTQPFEE